MTPLTLDRDIQMKSSPVTDASLLAQSAILKLDSVSKRFGSLLTLSDISLSIQPGEFVAIVGPSGCGKTTLLNVLSGHTEPSAGSVERKGIVRQVYQQDGLFPWMTVAQNIGLGVPGKEKVAAVTGMLELIRMQEFGEHFPHQLSGGMRQRVELARALVGDSDILLMDEPFSALDYITRLRMRREVAELFASRPKTVVLVTHDIEEAAQLADRVLALSERPARIERELVIDLPRPRDLTHPVVVNAIHTILMQLGLERQSATEGANHAAGS